jgi:hypothetical protein
MKVINGVFGRQKEATLREKLQHVFQHLAVDAPGSFLVLVEDENGEAKTATDLPITEVLYLLEMLKLTILLDAGEDINETVH